MDGLVVSYEIPYKFVLWDGGRAIAKFDTFPQIFEAISHIPREVLLKRSAVEKLSELMSHT